MIKMSSNETMIIKWFKGNNLVHTSSFQKLAFQDKLFYVLHKTPCEKCTTKGWCEMEDKKNYVLYFKLHSGTNTSFVSQGDILTRSYLSTMFTFLM